MINLKFVYLLMGQCQLHECCIDSGEHEVRCVKRRVLLETLANELPSNTIRFSSKVVSIQTSGYLKVVHLADGSTFMAKVYARLSHLYFDFRVKDKNDPLKLDYHVSFYFIFYH